jgi:hypothetical protein
MQNFNTTAQKIGYTANRLAPFWPADSGASLTAALETIADKRPALFEEIILLQHERDAVPALAAALEEICAAAEPFAAAAETACES